MKLEPTDFCIIQTQNEIMLAIKSIPFKQRIQTVKERGGRGERERQDKKRRGKKQIAHDKGKVTFMRSHCRLVTEKGTETYYWNLVSGICCLLAF